MLEHPNGEFKQELLKFENKYLLRVLDTNLIIDLIIIIMDHF